MTRLLEPLDDGSIRQRTFVCFILDASQSMEEHKAQVLSGYREYVETLQRDAGDLRFGLTTFNTECHRVVEPGTPIATVQPLTDETYQPNGMTALYDAIAETVKAMEAWLPDGDDWRALCVIQTDGLENRSRTQTKETLRALIEAKEATGRWTFTYLGANQDAWAEASKMGMAAGNVAGYAVADMAGTMRMAAASTVAYQASVDRQSRGFYQVVNTQMEDVTRPVRVIIDEHGWSFKSLAAKLSVPEDVAAGWYAGTILAIGSDVRRLRELAFDLCAAST